MLVKPEDLGGEFHFCSKCRDDIDKLTHDAKEGLSKITNFSALQPPKETHDASERFLVLSLAEVGIFYKCHECHEGLTVSLGDMYMRCYKCGGSNIYPACVKISMEKLREKAEQIKKIMEKI